MLLTGTLITAYLWVAVLLVFHIIPKSGMMVVLALPFAVRLRLALSDHASASSEESAMRWSALHHWVFGLLFALSLFV